MGICHKFSNQLLVDEARSKPQEVPNVLLFLPDNQTNMKNFLLNLYTAINTVQSNI